MTRPSSQAIWIAPPAWTSAAPVVLAVLLLTGCPPRPAGVPRTLDAGSNAQIDAGIDDDSGITLPEDAGTGNPEDSGVREDAGAVDDGGRPMPGDAGADAGADGGATRDAGEDVGVVDAGVVDAGASQLTDAGSEPAAQPEPEPEPGPEPEAEPDDATGEFVDVTDEFGVSSLYYDRVVDDFYCRFVAQMGGGIAVGDIDNDGFPEFLLTRFHRPAQLFTITPTGYIDIAPAKNLDFVNSGNGATFFDADDDGDLDLFVGSLSREPDRLYIQQPSGAFQEETAQRIPSPLVAGACGNVFSVIAVDVDKDGDLDLHTSQWNTVTLAIQSRSRLLLNDGTGHFSDGTLAASLNLSQSYAFTTLFADINDDSWPDALVSGDFGTSRVFLNQATTPLSFREQFFPRVALSDENGMGGALGDFDGDGDLDWFVTSIYDPLVPCGGRNDSWGCSGNRLYRNDFSSTGFRDFTDVTDAVGVRHGGWGWGVAFADIDNDGDVDLAHVNGYTANDESDALSEQFHFQPGRVFENVGGDFDDITTKSSFYDGGQGRGIVFFDFDQDGDLDVIVTNNKEGTLLFRNELSSVGNWLHIRLNTTRSPPRGVGVEVMVIRSPGATPMRRVIGANATFLSSPDTVAHFGLGRDNAPVYEVLVKWPNSASTTLLQNVVVNQELTIQEPLF